MATWSISVKSMPRSLEMVAFGRRRSHTTVGCAAAAALVRLLACGAGCVGRDSSSWLVASLAPVALPAGATATSVLPVAWRATSTAPLNEPTLTPTGVVTTGGTNTIERALARGTVLWTKSVADVTGTQAVLLTPVVSNGIVDSVIANGVGDGLADFAVSNGARTITPPAVHVLIGQLVPDGTTPTRIQGGYTPAIGLLLKMTLKYEWLVFEGAGSVGVPELIGPRAFVPVSSTIEALDPTHICQPASVDPSMCQPSWQTATAGAAQEPVAAGPGRIATTDSSGFVTAMNATNGAVAWKTASFHTPLGPPASSTTVVYAGGADGVLRAINAASGALVWKGSRRRADPHRADYQRRRASTSRPTMADSSRSTPRAAESPRAHRAQSATPRSPTRRPRVRH